MGLAEGNEVLVLQVESPGHSDGILQNGHSEVLIAHMRRDMEQRTARVRSIGDLDGIQSRVADICDPIGAVVRIRKRCGNTVESRVGDALVAVVEILTLRAARAILQLAKLHFLTGLSGITTWTLAPKVVPRHVARAVMIARTTHADVIRHYALEDLFVVERNVAELDQCGNVLCLKIIYYKNMLKDIYF